MQLIQRKTVTLVTIVYNNRAGFLRTAQSINEQKSEEIEWVVIDGSSTDGTKEEIEKCDYVDLWVSEPDDGISSAFNKGIMKSSGSYILFLNSGDTLIAGSLRQITETLEKSTSKQGILVAKTKYGNRIVGGPIKKWQQLVRNRLPHQAMFIGRSFFRCYGKYDESLELGMDYEWSLRILRQWNRMQFMNILVTEMEVDGRSIANFKTTYMNYHSARIRHCGDGILIAIMSLLVCKFFTFRMVIGNKVKNLRKV